MVIILMRDKVDIFSREFKGKIGFITFQGFLWMLKINWFGVLFIGCFGILLNLIVDSFIFIFTAGLLQTDILIKVLIYIVGVPIGAYINKITFYYNRVFNQEGDIEKLGSIEVTHHFIEAESIDWHYVEAGPKDAEVVIFLHGLPESWYTWNFQIEALSENYHVYAFDLKGYGQSDKDIGDYSYQGVSEQFIAVMDKLGIKKANFICHDRGSVLIDYLGGTHPERVQRYVRGQQVLHIWHPHRTPQEEMFIRPIIGTLANGNPRIIVPFAYARWYTYSKNKISKKIIKRTIYEYSYPKISWAVPRYFRTNGFAKELEDRKNRLLKNMDFPVLLLEAGMDPFQPRYYYEGGTDLFPNAQLKFIEGASHFWLLEKPEEVSQILLDFLADKKI